MSEHDMLQLDPDEQILLVVRRTLWGLALHFIISGLSFVAFLGFIYWLARYPEQVSTHGSSSTLFLVALAIELLIQMVINVLILTYRGNRIVVTNQSIVQRLQSTLFNQKISQLQLAHIQDVTFAQNGFIQQNLNFGSITVETAGEQANFEFKLARNPRRATQIIIEAQESVKLATEIAVAPPAPTG